MRLLSAVCHMVWYRANTFCCVVCFVCAPEQSLSQMTSTSKCSMMSPLERYRTTGFCVVWVGWCMPWGSWIGSTTKPLWPSATSPMATVKMLPAGS